MRDIDAYPITKAERLHALEQATGLLAKELAGQIGGIELIALAEVRKLVEALPD